MAAAGTMRPAFKGGSVTGADGAFSTLAGGGAETTGAALGAGGGAAFGHNRDGQARYKKKKNIRTDFFRQS